MAAGVPGVSQIVTGVPRVWDASISRCAAVRSGARQTPVWRGSTVYGQ